MLIVLAASPWEDGQSLNWLQSVQKARRFGIQIYSAGFGSSVRLPQLASIVNNPNRDAYIISPSDDPKERTRKLANEIARGGCICFMLICSSILLRLKRVATKNYAIPSCWKDIQL